MNIWSNLVIGVLGSVIASIIVLCVTSQKQTRTQVLVEAQKLRNILYEIEVRVSAMLSREVLPGWSQLRSVPMVISVDWWLDRHQWFYWHTCIRDVKSELLVLFHHNMLDVKTRGLFTVQRNTQISEDGGRTVEDHFRSLGSVFVTQAKEVQYLGLVEIATEAGNLVREAEFKCRELEQHASKVKEFQDRRPGGRMPTYNGDTDWFTYDEAGGIMGTRLFEQRVEEVRRRIGSHRKYIERVLGMAKTE